MTELEISLDEHLQKIEATHFVNYEEKQSAMLNGTLVIIAKHFDYRLDKLQDELGDINSNVIDVETAVRVAGDGIEGAVNQK